MTKHELGLDYNFVLESINQYNDLGILVLFFMNLRHKRVNPSDITDIEADLENRKILPKEDDVNFFMSQTFDSGTNQYHIQKIIEHIRGIKNSHIKPNN